MRLCERSRKSDQGLEGSLGGSEETRWSRPDRICTEERFGCASATESAVAMPVSRLAPPPVPVFLKVGCRIRWSRRSWDGVQPPQFEWPSAMLTSDRVACVKPWSSWDARQIQRQSPKKSP